MAFKIMHRIQIISIGILLYSITATSTQPPVANGMSNNLSTPAAFTPTNTNTILNSSSVSPSENSTESAVQDTTFSTSNTHLSASSTDTVLHESTPNPHHIGDDDGGGRNAVNDTFSGNGTNVCDNTTSSGNNSCTDKEEDEDDHDHDHVGFLPTPFYIFFIYFILIMGLIGNVTIFTLMFLRFPGISYSIYLRFLAVMDSVVLITVCTEDILDHQFHSLDEFVHADLGFCILWNYIYDVARLASPWFVVIFTLDRFITVAYPMTRLKLCTVKKALIASGLLFLACVIESSIFAIVTRENCDKIQDENTRRYYIFRLIASESALPCIAILVLNICIIVCIRGSLNIRKMFNETQSETSSELSITLSLVAVSIMVFFTLIPTSVVETMEVTWYETADEDEPAPTDIDNASETWPLLNLVRLLNFGQNGYIMLMTSYKCRTEFKTLPLINRICRPKQQEQQEEGSQTVADADMWSIG